MSLSKPIKQEDGAPPAPDISRLLNQNDGDDFMPNIFFPSVKQKASHISTSRMTIKHAINHMIDFASPPVKQEADINSQVRRSDRIFAQNNPFVTQRTRGGFLVDSDEDTPTAKSHRQSINPNNRPTRTVDQDMSGSPLSSQLKRSEKLTERQRKSESANSTKRMEARLKKQLLRSQREITKMMKNMSFREANKERVDEADSEMSNDGKADKKQNKRSRKKKGRVQAVRDMGKKNQEQRNNANNMLQNVTTGRVEKNVGNEGRKARKAKRKAKQKDRKAREKLFAELFEDKVSVISQFGPVNGV